MNEEKECKSVGLTANDMAFIQFLALYDSYRGINSTEFWIKKTKKGLWYSRDTTKPSKHIKLAGINTRRYKVDDEDFDFLNPFPKHTFIERKIKLPNLKKVYNDIIIGNCDLVYLEKLETVGGKIKIDVWGELILKYPVIPSNIQLELTGTYDFMLPEIKTLNLNDKKDLETVNYLLKTYEKITPFKVLDYEKKKRYEIMQREDEIKKKKLTIKRSNIIFIGIFIGIFILAFINILIFK